MAAVTFPQHVFKDITADLSRLDMGNMTTAKYIEMTVIVVSRGRFFTGFAQSGCSHTDLSAKLRHILSF
jgi:hypothetical protein